MRADPLQSKVFQAATNAPWVRYLPVAVAGVGLVAFIVWITQGPGVALAPRLPGADRTSAAADGAVAGGNPVLLGKVTRGDGQPADLPGIWPGFRGPSRSGITPADATGALARTWPATGPRQLWTIDLGEGYAGPAVLNGRVYLIDYDREHKQDALRCLSLADGKEIWRLRLPRRRQAQPRHVTHEPAVTEQAVVAMGPKGQWLADATTGELRNGDSISSAISARRCRPGTRGNAR